MAQSPIFFAFTRSFWLSVLGIGAILAGDTAAIQAFATLLGPLIEVAPEDITAWALKVAPAVLFVAAIQQRSGASRPYSLDPRNL